MRIAIAGGKGGTGKTTFAASMADALAASGRAAAYVDCDVEEPNGHIFLNPEIHRCAQVGIPVPKVDLSRCTYCGACSDACRFSAIVTVGKQVLTFPKLCHGCGGCTLSCPEFAIREINRPIGVLEEGNAGDLVFLQGRLDIGEPMSPPLIRAVLEAAPARDTIVIVDAPAGTSCPVIEAIKDADVVLLVTEPTPFGVNDLKLAVAMARVLGLPLAVAVNRADVGNREVFEFCAQEDIPVLFELRDDRKIAEAYSRGELATQVIPELGPQLCELAKKLEQLARRRQRRPIDLPGSHYLDPKPLPVPPSRLLNLGPPELPQELVVLSGKGGTGKTSVVASFFALADNVVATDCDADAADLHLVVDPKIQSEWPFSGGSHAKIDSQACLACEICVDYCRFDAIRPVVDDTSFTNVFAVDPIACEGCGVCVDCCPECAIELVLSTGSKWFLSQGRHGPVVHGQLGIAQANSGKLVSLLRQEARELATAERRQLIIVDGSPGIGCPVIASVTGADLVLLVTEPTLSGLHDLKRVAELCRHFDVTATVCINKADLNTEMAERLAAEAEGMGLTVVGHVRYDPAVTRAQLHGKSVVEEGDSPAAEDIRSLWARIQSVLQLNDHASGGAGESAPVSQQSTGRTT